MSMGEGEDKITRDELVDLFGEMMPIEAAQLVFESPRHMTVGELRARLRCMAKPTPQWIATRIVAEAGGTRGLWRDETEPSDDDLNWLRAEIAAEIKKAMGLPASGWDGQVNVFSGDGNED